MQNTGVIDFPCRVCELFSLIRGENETFMQNCKFLNIYFNTFKCSILATNICSSNNVAQTDFGSWSILMAW